ncbi:MAG: hypothetical protein LBR83_06660, partial [Clostridiales bacterium]|nr:hypothetical protein [Clostridiales bacterium]
MKKKSTWKKLAAALMTLALVLGSVNYTRSVYAETSPGSIEGAVGGNVEYELDSELAIVEGSANDTQVTVNVKVITKSSADAEVGEVKTAQITVPAGTKINFTVTPNTAGNPQYMLESLDDSAATNPWDANNGTTLVNAHRTRLEYDPAYNNEGVPTGIAYKDADTIKWSLNGSTQPVCDFRVTAVSDRTLTITFHEIHRIAAQSLVYGENKVEWARSAEASLYSIEGDDYESVIAEMNRLYQKADSSQSGLGAPTKAEILLPVVKDNAWNANGESSEVWDSGNSYGMYKSYNMQNMLANMDAEEASRLKWASWLHQFTWSPFGNPEEGDTNQSVSTKTSLRRFTTTLNVTAIDINNMEYFTFGLSGEDRQIMTDANNGAYYNETEFGINDSMFVVVINATYPTGMLCFFGGVNFNEDRPVITWNGEDEERLAIANQRFWHSGQYKTPTAEEEALFKAKFPFTDGHYIDFETTEVADLKEFLAPGENRIEIFTDEDAEGGGMNEPCLYLKTNTSQNLSTQVITYTHNSDGDPVVDTSNDSGNGGATENPVNVQNSISTSGHVVPYGFPQVVTQKVTAGTDEYTFLGWDVYTYPNDATPAVPSGLELYNLTPETASRFNLTYFGSYDEQGNRLADEAADSQSKVNATDKSLRVDMKTNYHVVAKYVQNPPEPPVKGTV